MLVRELCPRRAFALSSIPASASFLWRTQGTPDPRRGEARRGEARRGEARRGEARRGEARRSSLKCPRHRHGAPFPPQQGVVARRRAAKQRQPRTLFWRRAAGRASTPRRRHSQVMTLAGRLLPTRSPAHLRWRQEIARKHKGERRVASARGAGLYRACPQGKGHAPGATASSSLTDGAHAGLRAAADEVAPCVVRLGPPHCG